MARPTWEQTKKKVIVFISCFLGGNNINKVGRDYSQLKINKEQHNGSMK